MAFRISRRALQLAIAQAIAIATANLKRATARQQWRDSITGTVTVRIHDAAGTLKATVTRPQAQAGDWATLEADSAVFAWAGTTSTVASAGNPPSAAPWWTMHFEDAGGEFAVMTVGSRASSGADYKLDPIKVGVPVRLRNLVFATNPALAGSGGGSGTAATDTARITTLQVKNMGTASEVQPRIVTGIPVGPEDAAGSMLLQLRTTDGTVIATQSDARSTWDTNGGIKFENLSFRLPDTLAAGQTVDYEVWRVPGTADRTPAVTLAQVAANSDFKMEFTGHTLGADTYVASVNAIIAAGNAADANGGFGANPLTGYEVLRVGPVCCEWRLWTWIKRTSDNGYHRWIKVVFFLRAWSTGLYDVSAWVRQPNLVNPGPGTLGGTSAIKHEFNAVLKNGATVIRYFGGANDPRKVSFDASAIDISTNRITMPAGTKLKRAMPVRITTTGTLPGGLSADTTYFIERGWGNTSSAKLFALRGHSITDPDAFAPVDITSQGAGTHTIAPIMCTYQRCGWHTFDETARLDRVGGARPDVYVGHDFQYLTQRSRAVMPFDDSIPMSITDSAVDYQPLSHNLMMAGSLGGTGDGTDDERIGYHSRAETYAYKHPFSASWVQRTRQAAAWWTDFHIIAENEATGRFINKTKDALPGLGPSMKTFAYHSSGSPAAIWPPTAADSDGNESGYQPILEGSHLPNHWFGEYIRSGEFWALETGQALVTMLWAACISAQRPEHGARFASVFLPLWEGLTQHREVWWSLRTAEQLYHVTPDSNVYKPLAKEAINSCLDFVPVQAQARYAAMQSEKVGFALGYVEGGAFTIHSRDHGFGGIVLGMLRWKGEFAQADSVWNAYYKKPVQFLADPAHGGCGYFINYTGMKLQAATGQPYFTTWQQAFDNKTGQANFACPVSGSINDGNIGGSGPNSYGSVLTCAIAINAVADGGASTPAAALAQALRARLGANLNNDPRYSAKAF